MNPSNSTQAMDLFVRAQRSLASNKGLSALRFAEEAWHLDSAIPGLNGFLAQCLAGLGRFSEARAAVDRELLIAPATPDLIEFQRSIMDALSNRESQEHSKRQWASCLKPETMQPIEEASHRYTYRGYPMIKNPFDMALYPLLLWNLKPATILEIGSYNGASALWMADTMNTYGIDARVWSLDIVKVTEIEHPKITFLAGSGRKLEEVFSQELLENAPRPFLVIDDADHTYATSIAVLEFFHPHMQKDEFIVIEDGLTAEGPRQALTEFLPKHEQDYEVAANYCDFFGYNATWCVNGFLRRK